MSNNTNKMFLDLSKCMVPTNTNSTNNKQHFSSSLNQNQCSSLFSNSSKAYVNSQNQSNSASILPNDITKRISTSPRSTSSYNSGYTSGCTLTNTTGSILTGSNSSCSASSQSGSCGNSVLTYSSSASYSNSVFSSTIHGEDSNMSPYSSSFDSRNASSASSNDEDDTAKIKSPKSSLYNKNNISMDTQSIFSSSNSSNFSSTTTTTTTTPSRSNSNSPTSNSAASTCTSRTTRASRKSLLLTVDPTGDSTKPNEKLKCKWKSCYFIGKSIDQNDSLMSHIKTMHINSQKKRQNFKCFWTDCKYFDKKSKSFSWLERHVVDHIDTKPYCCIIGECKKKFRTHADLNKHVQSHMNNSSNNNGVNESPQKMRSQDLLRTSVALIQNELKRKDSNVKKRNKESGSPSSACSSLDNKTSKTFENLSSRDLLQGDAKLLPDCFTQLTKDLTKRKNTQKNINQIKKFKKVQYEDFMDDCTAELIADKLAMLNYDSGMVSFDFSVLATSQQYGIESYYIEWVPENIIEPEWIEKADLFDRVNKMRCVTMSDLKKLELVNHKSNPLYRTFSFRRRKSSK